MQRKVLESLYNQGGLTLFAISDEEALPTEALHKFALALNAGARFVVIDFTGKRPFEGKAPFQTSDLSQKLLSTEDIEQITASAADDGCKIKGYACWDVIQKLGQTEEVRTPKENPTEEDLWLPDNITYKNPALEAMGIKVTFYTMYRDGGSTQYVLDDEVAIRTNNAIAAPAEEKGTKTVKFKNGPTFKYAPDGTLLK